MQTHLTRRVLRCILVNEPIPHSLCSSARSYSTTSRWHTKRHPSRHQQCSTDTHQRRSIFSFFSPRRQDAASIGSDPGVEKMMEFEKRVRLRARLVPVDVMEEAIGAYLRKRKELGQAIPDTHIRLLHQSFEYVLRERRKEIAESNEDWTQQPLSANMVATLHAAAKALCLEGEGTTEDHVRLVRLLLDEATQRPNGPRAKLTNTLVAVLCNRGQPLQARDLLEQRALSAADDKSLETEHEGIAEYPADHSVRLSAQIRTPWRHVIRAFAKLNDEVETLRTFRMAENYNFGSRKTFAGVLVQLYARIENVQELKKWFGEWLHGSFSDITAQMAQEDAETLRLALECCYRTDQLELGNAFVRMILDRALIKRLWDEVLVWALRTQKSVDEVDRMIGVMIESVQGKRRASSLMPNIETINRLVETAIAAEDPYMAERVINLGRERNIHPDARTLVLQIKYRLKVGDVDGALIAYKHLQSKDLNMKEHVLATNELIVALCRSKRHDYETVMNVVADLADQRAPFFVDTVKTLCLVHLRRDEFHDLTDLIRTHVPNFSSADRLSIQKAIADFCFEPQTPLAQVWDAYEILRTDFDEMDRETRTKFMQVCFSHGRGDLAAQIFHHMRRHSRADTIPTSHTYVTAFLECAKARDARSLEVIHNQLKLDVNIDVNTQIRNALMSAYVACEQSREAYRVWEDIVDSKEGPSFKSLHIVFRGCERMASGDERALEIWQRLRKNNIDIDAALWASYLAALTSNGSVQGTINTLTEGIHAGEVEADELIVGSMYNVAARAGKEKLVQDWASQACPMVWQSLHEKGYHQDEDGVSVLKLDRSVAL